MDPNLARPERPHEDAPKTPDAADELVPASPEPPPNVWSGAPGAVLAIAVSGLLIVGLWAVSRNAPSAGTDPRLAPTATAAPGTNPFGEQVFVTVVPEPAPPPPATAVTDAGGA